jgi:hypothetical protein
MAFAAYLIGYKKFEMDLSLVICQSHWTDPGNGEVIELPVPRCRAYEDRHGMWANEVIVFLMCLTFVIWGLRTKKAADGLHWIAIGIGLVGAVYLPLLWLARQHVEGDWRPTPMLMPVPVPTPTEQDPGLSRIGLKIQSVLVVYICIFIFGGAIA